MERTQYRQQAIRLSLGLLGLLLAMLLFGGAAWAGSGSQGPAGSGAAGAQPADSSSRPGGPMQGTPTATPASPSATPSPSITPCTGWQVVASANVVTSTVNWLQTGAAVAPNDVWAAGWHIPPGTPQRTLIQHWDGTAWTIVPSPSPGNGNHWIYALAAVSANDVWAFGSYVDTGTVRHLLTLHWNGIAWTPVTMPEPSATSNLFRGAVALAANNIWAVGFYTESQQCYANADRALGWAELERRLQPQPGNVQQYPVQGERGGRQ